MELAALTMAHSPCTHRQRTGGLRGQAASPTTTMPPAREAAADSPTKQLSNQRHSSSLSAAAAASVCRASCRCRCNGVAKSNNSSTINQSFINSSKSKSCCCCYYPNSVNCEEMCIQTLHAVPEWEADESKLPNSELAATHHSDGESVSESSSSIQAQPSTVSGPVRGARRLPSHPEPSSSPTKSSPDSSATQAASAGKSWRHAKRSSLSPAAASGVCSSYVMLALVAFLSLSVRHISAVGVPGGQEQVMESYEETGSKCLSDSFCFCCPFIGECDDFTP